MTPATSPSPGQVAAVSRTQRALGLVFAGLCGIASAGQARINGELGGRLRDGFAAALISFSVGLALLLLMVPALPSGRRGLANVRAALSTSALRPWEVLGGTCGAFLVATQGLTVAALGVAVFTVAMVAGQAGSSLAVDRAGIGPGEPAPLTATRVLGAVLAVVAVVVAVSDELGDPAVLGLAVLPTLAGVGAGWQQAVNGKVRMVSGSALSAAMVNFAVGTAVLVVVFAVRLAVRGVPEELPTEWWLYLGGALGVLYIATSAVVVRWTGVLLLGLASIAGQLIGALLLDVVAPAPGEHISVATLVGTGLTLIAVMVAVLPSRGSKSASP